MAAGLGGDADAPADGVEAFLQSGQTAAGVCGARRGAVVAQQDAGLTCGGGDGDPAVAGPAVAQDVGDALADQGGEGRLELVRDACGVAVDGGADPGGLQDSGGVDQFGAQAGAPIAVDHGPGLLQGGAGQVGDLPDLHARIVVAAADQPLGELALERDDLEAVALEVVQIGGEPQPLFRHGQGGRGLADVFGLQHRPPQPDQDQLHPGDEQHHRRAGQRRHPGQQFGLVMTPLRHRLTQHRAAHRDRRQ